jgi:hypothetical protein
MKAGASKYTSIFCIVFMHAFPTVRVGVVVAIFLLESLFSMEFFSMMRKKDTEEKSGRVSKGVEKICQKIQKRSLERVCKYRQVGRVKTSTKYRQASRQLQAHHALLKKFSKIVRINFFEKNMPIKIN